MDTAIRWTRVATHPTSPSRSHRAREGSLFFYLWQPALNHGLPMHLTHLPLGSDSRPGDGFPTPGGANVIGFPSPQCIYTVLKERRQNQPAQPHLDLPPTDVCFSRSR